MMFKKLLRNANKKYLEMMIKNNHNNNVKEVLKSGLIESITEAINNYSSNGYSGITIHVYVPYNTYRDESKFNVLEEKEYKYFSIYVKGEEIAIDVIDFISNYYGNVYNVSSNESHNPSSVFRNSFTVKISWKSLLEKKEESGN